MLVLCPECGHRVSDQAPSCPQCGYPLGRAAQARGAAAGEAPSQASKRQRAPGRSVSRKKLRLVAVFAVLFLCLS